MLASLQQFRRRVGAFIGGFEAGLANRRLRGFQPSRAHLNTLIAAAGPDITARARWLVRNNGYAANAIESWAGNVVGAGIKPSSLIADASLKPQVQKLWLAWTDEADAEGFTDFYDQQRRAARDAIIAGELFFRLRPRRKQDGFMVPLQLQMIPSEMLPLNRNEAAPGGNVIRQGIEFDAIGRQRRREYLACGWLPPKWDWVDPMKDARAEIEQIDAGLKSRTQALAERGYDAEQVDAEIAADKAREGSLGLAFGSVAGAAMVADAVTDQNLDG